MKKFLFGMMILLVGSLIVMAQPLGDALWWSVDEADSADGRFIEDIIGPINGNYYLCGYDKESPYSGGFFATYNTTTGFSNETSFGDCRYLRDFIMMSPSEIVCAGASFDEDYDGYGLVINSSGTVLDDFSYDVSDQDEEFYGVSAADDGYIFVGDYVVPPLNLDHHGLIVKTDTDLNVEWYINDVGDYLYDIHPLGSDAYVVVGNNLGYTFAAKIEDQGTSCSVEWQETYASATYAGGFRAVDIATGGRFVAAGNSGDGPIIAGIELDDGDIDWFNQYESEYFTYFYDVIHSTDGIVAAGAGSPSTILPLVVKYDDDGTKLWEKFVTDPSESYSTGFAYGVTEVDDDQYAIAGFVVETPTQFDPLIADVVGLEAPQELTIMPTSSGAPITYPHYELNWKPSYAADGYMIYYTDDVEDPFELWTYLDYTTSTSYEDSVADTLDVLRFYKVLARRQEGGVTFYSEPCANTAGYCMIFANGTTYMSPYATPFSLPFKFWEIVGGEPDYGVESTKPSDIIVEQANPGGGISSDKIVKQGAGQAYRDNTIGNAWTGTLESNEEMTPGDAYWYVNKTGERHRFLLCGEVSNGGYPTTYINPATYYKPYGWREARQLNISELGLIDGDTQFQGGDAITSDKIVEQGGQQANYIIGTGWDNDYQLVPGRAYWIVNKQQGEGTDDWYYLYEPPEE